MPPPPSALMLMQQQPDVQATAATAATATHTHAADPAGGYETFRSDVCTWLDLDTSIRALQAGIRERREAKLKLTKQIAAFMERNEIADMSTRAGRLRFQIESVREPLSHKTIRDRISEFYSSSPETASELSGAVFGNRQRCERVALRRVR